MLRTAIAPRPDPVSDARPDWSALFGALPVGILLVDADGRIARANAPAEQLLNLSERLMTAQPLAGLLRSPSIEAVARGEDLAIYDAEVITGGMTLRLDLTASHIPDWPGWRVVTLHAAGPRHLPARSETGRVAVGAAAMLAHEIKNPLSGIRGAAQLLGPGELTTLIVAEVDRVAALIDRMQLFTDTRPLPLSAGNIYPVLSHVRRIASAGVAQGIPIEESYDPSLPPALINNDALIQVLLNLLKNASEALVEVKKPSITITTAYRHGTARRMGEDRQVTALPIEIGVVDNGPGPPSEIAGQLFEPFVSGRRDGTGLGLALVDKLVRDMGGLVQCTREHGRTVFRLLLARAPG
ncbi:MAG TPA: ATP-binding protein [Sphingomonas sp.]|jgi:two-component system nitrogen regulation sensor histidine kinase GlnL|uniref:two-component system sensor histidine kinase NtrB n=1 Tax=Sphingomonas sp. TaxID=28214 RepID=UPI002ED87F75